MSMNLDIVNITILVALLIVYLRTRMSFLTSVTYYIIFHNIVICEGLVSLEIYNDNRFDNRSSFTYKVLCNEYKAAPMNHIMLLPHFS